MFCPHCHGIIGADCFNVQECGEITQDMEKNNWMLQIDEILQNANRRFDAAISKTKEDCMTDKMKDPNDILRRINNDINDFLNPPLSRFPDTTMNKPSSPTEPSIGDPKPIHKDWCMNVAKKEDGSDISAGLPLDEGRIKAEQIQTLLRTEMDEKHKDSLIHAWLQYENLVFALKNIASGHFHNASNLAVAEDWKFFVDKLQDIATTALNQAGEL